MLTLAITTSQTSNGAIVTATASGGTAPYTYQWSAPTVASYVRPDLIAAGLLITAPASASTAVTVWDGGYGGVYYGQGDIPNMLPGTPNTGGMFTITCTVTDSASATATLSATINGADRSRCYFNADADADYVAGIRVPSVLIPAYLALTDGPQKAAILAKATADIDNAMRYQGEPYDLVYQICAFPRLAHVPSTRGAPSAYGFPGGAVPQGAVWGEVVWDVDPATNQAIVPQDVLTAAIYQANFIAAGGSSRVNNQFQGLSDVQTGGLRETYRDGNEAVRTRLCADAWQLLKKYELRTGRLL